MAKKKVYSVDVKICATAYIKATSASQAHLVAQGLKDCSPTILDHPGGVEISGRDFDDPRLPAVSLSPAMTIHGIWPGSVASRADD